MIGVIKGIENIDRTTKNLISRLNDVISMMVNLSLVIRYCPERSEPNLIVLVKGLPTNTYCAVRSEQ